MPTKFVVLGGGIWLCFLGGGAKSANWIFCGRGNVSDGRELPDMFRYWGSQKHFR